MCRSYKSQHLSKKHAFFKNLHFDARIILLPSTLPAPDKLPAELIRYLQGLADEAYQTASSQAYSSILAGQGNETDEAWDVPIYLGERPSSGGDGSQEDWAWIVQVLGGKEEGLVDEEVSAFVFLPPTSVELALIFCWCFEGLGPSTGSTPKGAPIPQITARPDLP